MTPEEYRQHDAELRKVFEICRPELAEDTVSAVQLYIDHAEIEMAGELLCLDLIEKQEALPKELCQNLYSLALALGLDKETVYDVDFWGKFSALTKAGRCN